jgi:mRNA-degrading endonuclease RelE of RelBE toxin-antitoxin system
VSYRVSITPTGQRSVDALRGKGRRSFDAAIERLAAEGCKAGDYRLTGEGIEHICSVHVYGRHRILVCFPEEDSVVVLVAGEHLRDSPELDVYRALYRLLGLPEPSAQRTKPPCCDEAGQAPIDSELLDRFRAGAKALTRRRQPRPRR